VAEHETSKKARVASMLLESNKGERNTDVLRFVGRQALRQTPSMWGGTTYVPLSAVSFIGGFRTPAAQLAAPSLKRPASETLYTSGHRQADVPPPML